MSAIAEIENVIIFKSCLHAFCKDCVRQDASASIKSGDLSKIKCPAMISNTKRCPTMITEKELERVGVSKELINKMTEFSIN